MSHWTDIPPMYVAPLLEHAVLNSGVGLLVSGSRLGIVHRCTLFIFVPSWLPIGYLMEVDLLEININFLLHYIVETDL